MNYLVRANLTEIANLQDIIKTDELHYKLKHKRCYF